MNNALLSRVEQASINASAAPEQRWLDGWLIRSSPGKAKRARCINAVAEGHLLLDAKLRLAAEIYREACLPLLVRLTPFVRPTDLDQQLDARRFGHHDPTQVMILSQLERKRIGPLPAGLHWRCRGPTHYAEVVGELRGSGVGERLAHAIRLSHSPIPYQGFALTRADNTVVACGQYAREGEFVGIYDVVTAPDQRGNGFADGLCRRLLSLAAAEGATCAYLQVDEKNAAARNLYKRLGFVDGYAYHYRVAPTSHAQT